VEHDHDGTRTEAADPAYLLDAKAGGGFGDGVLFCVSRDSLFLWIDTRKLHGCE
jgi:hypothetical protein